MLRDWHKTWRWKGSLLMLLELPQNQIGQRVRKGMSEQLLQFCLLQLSKLGKILTTLLNIGKKMFSTELQQWTQPCNKNWQNSLKRANITADNLCLTKLNLKRNCSLIYELWVEWPKKNHKKYPTCCKTQGWWMQSLFTEIATGKGEKREKVSYVEASHVLLQSVPIQSRQEARYLNSRKLLRYFIIIAFFNGKGIYWVNTKKKPENFLSRSLRQTGFYKRLWRTAPLGRKPCCYLAILGVTHRVRLSVLDSNGGHYEVSERRCWQLWKDRGLTGSDFSKFTLGILHIIYCKRSTVLLHLSDSSEWNKLFMLSSRFYWEPHCFKCLWRASVQSMPN